MTVSPVCSGSERIIYDVLYGFIPITEWEEKIINSPFFQRLRWIKQLGFANYIFPGAEHNRFAHVIGVMHSMDQMLRSLQLAVPDSELFNPKARSEQAMLHKSLRIAALLHDIGTFPFSHAIEHAYIRHGNDERRDLSSQKALPNSHEHLGSFLIKNTDYPQGLTRILNDAGFDVHRISRMIKGESKELVANQLMHSDLDCDRMDYLLRDSHYTGINYGQFDRGYLMANLALYTNPDGQVGFGVKENAIHAIDHFLMARWCWYSQIIKHSGSAKFDIISSYIAQGFLQEDLIYQFSDILQMVEDQDERFFWWNDLYFMNRCNEVRSKGLTQNARLLELIEMLLYRKAPKRLEHPLFEHRILASHPRDPEKLALFENIKECLEQIQKILKQKGTGKEWILADIPSKGIVFTHSAHNEPPSLFEERESIKIISRTGKVSLLVDQKQTLMKNLSQVTHFIPSVYANQDAYDLLQSELGWF